MSFNSQDFQNIMRLTKLDLTEQEQVEALADLNRLYKILFDELQAVNTDNVEPLLHPLSLLEPLATPLREDKVTEPSSEAHRDQLMQNAPASEKGLFLVPKVIE